MKNGKLWIICSLIITVGLLLCMAGIAFIIDPLNYYRWDGFRFCNSGVYFNPGIVRNYGADYYVIGSSMIQNTDMDQIRSTGIENPVKLGKGGMSFNEILILLRLIRNEDQTSSMMINLDLSTLITANEIELESEVFPKYMYNETSLDDWKYLLGFETWYRYLPVTFCMLVLNHIVGRVPSLFDDVLDIDNIGRWYEADIDKFGKDRLINAYLNDTGGTTKIFNIEVSEQFAKVDQFIEYFTTFTADCPLVTVGFPPYSALYWYVQKDRGIMNELLEVKMYLIQSLLKLDNVRIVDMQSLDEINDLDHYKDQTHYDLELQSIYTDAFISSEGNINTVNDTMKSNEKLNHIVAVFEEQNKDWL